MQTDLKCYMVLDSAAVWKFACIILFTKDEYMYTDSVYIYDDDRSHAAHSATQVYNSTVPSTCPSGGEAGRVRAHSDAESLAHLQLQQPARMGP